MSGRGSTTPAAFSVACEPVEQQQEWGFFCECGGYGCDKRVNLTVAGYRELHDAGGAVLAPGHQCSERVETRHSLP